MELTDEDLERLTERNIRLVSGLILRCEDCGFSWAVKLCPTSSKSGRRYRVKILTLPGRVGTWARCPRCSLADSRELAEVEARKKNTNPLRLSDGPIRTDLATVGYTRK